MITLLDGAMGQELMNRSQATPTALWGLQVMMDHPEMVEEIHRDYFAAGALIATANTYNALPDRLELHGDPAQLEPLLHLALAAANRARDAHGSGFVAGAIGPLGGSYIPDTESAPEAVAEVYAKIIAIQAPHVDVILFETIASVAHAKGALLAAATAKKPVWLGITVDDNDGSKLRSGEDIALIPTGADALLFNCSLPEAVTTATATSNPDVPMGAYANGFVEISEAFLHPGQTVDDLAPRADLGPAAYTEHARGWVKNGTTIVGGCCEIGPAHIAHLADALRADGHTLANQLPDRAT